jgi:hypothetical protein
MIARQAPQRSWVRRFFPASARGSLDFSFMEGAREISKPARPVDPAARARRGPVLEIEATSVIPAHRSVRLAATRSR